MLYDVALLHLIQSHLIECGLQTTSSTLRSKSGGVGLPGLFPNSKGSLIASAQNGQWGEVLQLLDGLDAERHLEDYLRVNNGEDGNKKEGNDDEHQSSLSLIITPLEKAVAMAHELTILELAEHNEVELAYTTLRMCSEMLDRSLAVNDNGGSNDNSAFVGMISFKPGDVERRITALSSMRRSSASAADNAVLLPSNYYGPSCLKFH